MGTRHRQAVITKEGDLKVNQYGQWDGYPSGQGADILKYLRNGNLEKYQENLSNLREINPQEEKMLEGNKNWAKDYPYMSRDCGSDIHQMIEDGNVKFLGYVDEEDARQWCEGFYTIDFQRGLFISEFYDDLVEVPLDNLPSENEYLAMFTGENI